MMSVHDRHTLVGSDVTKRKLTTRTLPLVHGFAKTVVVKVKHRDNKDSNIFVVVAAHTD